MTLALILLALILLALLVSAVGGAAYYHLRTLESYYDNMLDFQAKQISVLRDDLEQERSERLQAQDLQARYSLLLAGKISELQEARPAGKLILFAPPRDRN